MKGQERKAAHDKRRRCSAVAAGVFGTLLLASIIACAQTPGVPPATQREAAPVPSAPQSSERASAPAPSLPSSSPDPLQAPGTHVRWYGWQTLLSDGGAFALMLAGTKTSSMEGLTIAGGLVYALGGPAIHDAHGHTGKALGSLGLRILLPVIGGVAGDGIAAHDCAPGTWLCGLNGVGPGMLAGAGIAALIDATVLANEDVPDEPSFDASFSVTPVLSAGSGNYSAGVAGTF